MRILQLTAHFYPNLGGVETHLNDLVLELQNRDFDVFVLTYVPLSTEAKYKLFEHSEKLTIFRIPWIKGFFYQFVNRPILEFIYLIPGLFFATPFVLIYSRPRVIQAHGLVAGTVGVFWGKIFRKRVLVTTHSVYHFPKAGLYSKFARWIFNAADHVLVLSNQSKNEVMALGVPEEKISVFTYWVDQERFKPMDKEKQKMKLNIGKNFLVLFVGRLVEEKGILVLLNAVNNFKENITLLIAGDGPLRNLVQEYESKNQHIKYLGRIEQEDLPSTYNAADVLVVPSVHEEGFGRIILESLSCGTPVIASKRGGIVEAMDESVGVLIPITEENLDKAIKKLRVSKFNREKIAQYAKKRFSVNNINAIINSYGQ